MSFRKDVSYLNITLIVVDARLYVTTFYNMTSDPFKVGDKLLIHLGISDGTIEISKRMRKDRLEVHCKTVELYDKLMVMSDDLKEGNSLWITYKCRTCEAKRF